MTPVLAQAAGLTGVEARFVAFVDQALASPGLAVAAVFVALGVGAIHALAPGHGKAVAAAYLVGGRGRSRDALLLGLVVAVMHTASVLILGLGLQLWLRRGAGLPTSAAEVTPALRLCAGLAVLLLGIALLVRQWRARAGGHRHDPAPQVSPFSRRGLVLLGMSGGLLPSPSAFLVLVTTSFSGRLGFGLLLLAMFSVGLAATLTVIGLAVVHGRQALVDRVSAATQQRFTRLAARAAAVVITAGGAAMTVAGAAAL